MLRVDGIERLLDDRLLAERDGLFQGNGKTTRKSVLHRAGPCVGPGRRVKLVQSLAHLGTGVSGTQRMPLQYLQVDAGIARTAAGRNHARRTSRRDVGQSSRPAVRVVRVLFGWSSHRAKREGCRRDLGDLSVTFQLCEGNADDNGSNEPSSHFW